MTPTETKALLETVDQLAAANKLLAERAEIIVTCHAALVQAERSMMDHNRECETYQYEPCNRDFGEAVIGGTLDVIHAAIKLCEGRAPDQSTAIADLLHALKEIVGAAEHCGDGDAPVVVRAIAAINRAEGRTP